MNNFGMLVNKKFLTLLLTSEKTELSDDFNTLKDLILFLVKYAFILNDTTSYNNFLKREFPKHEELFFKNSNVARYLDPKYSRWISVDPALGEYVPLAPVNDEAKKHNENLPGMGGLFNTVNLSLYHYAGNNPIRYVDPDGRADVYSYKYRDNLYVFSPDISNLDGAIRSLYGLIPFVGDWIYEKINNAMGFKTIEVETGFSRLKSTASFLLDTYGTLDKVIGITSLADDVLKIVGPISRVAGWLSNILVSIDAINQLSKGDEVALNKLIDFYFGDLLVSNSHENVSALYLYARTRCCELVEKGAIVYEADWFGERTKTIIKIDEFNLLREELKELNKVLKETD